MGTAPDLYAKIDFLSGDDWFMVNAWMLMQGFDLIWDFDGIYVSKAFLIY